MLGEREFSKIEKVNYFFEVRLMSINYFPNGWRCITNCHFDENGSDGMPTDEADARWFYILISKYGRNIYVTVAEQTTACTSEELSLAGFHSIWVHESVDWMKK